MYKTAFLMIVLTLIFMYVGQLVGGAEGMKMAFLAACGMNFFSYFFSDKLVLKQYNAKEATSQTAHMFIINPFNKIPSGLTRLFSTHPSTKDRLNALENIRQQLL